MLFSPGGVAAVAFHLKRPGHPDFTAPVSDIPFRFDDTSDFRVIFAAPGGAVVLAPQHRWRCELDMKAWGRMVSFGLVVDDPRAWVVPTRRPFVYKGILDRSLCYVG